MTSVSISYLHPGHVETEFHICLLRMLHRDALRPEGRLINGHLPVEANSGGITDSRNKAVAGFLERFEDEWLWIVDSDMGFAPDAVDRLLASADPAERPIVGGLCFAQFVLEHGADELGVPQAGFGYFPTIYRWNDEQQWPETVRSYPQDAVVECVATGAACLLVHRSVFEKMATEYSAPHHWFARPIVNGREMGEDIAFCLRARACGFPIFVDTSVKTSHKKHHYLTEDSVEQLVRAQSFKPGSDSDNRARDEGYDSQRLSRAERRRRARASA